MRRAIEIGIGCAIGVALGCGPIDELRDQPCLGAADCGRGLHCVRTPEEEAADLPGTCQEDADACLEGEQLGCACTVATVDGCGFVFRPRPEGYPELACDVQTDVCVVALDPTEEETES